MKYKIIPNGNLENIMTRLKGVTALLFTLSEVAEVSSVSEDTIIALGDMLRGVVNDLRADVESSEDYMEVAA